MRSCSRLLAAAALAAATLAGASGGRITVAREATVPGDVIRLGEVATLEGDAARALAGVALGAAPTAGEARMLDGASVLAALRRAAGSLDGIVYTIPAAVRVRRATQEVPEAVVRQTLEAFLAETLGGGAGDAVVRSVELSGPIRIPAGPYRARVIPPAGTPLLGRVRLQVEFTADDRPVKTSWITADVGLYAPVVVARRPIARGEKLAADDLSLDRRDLSQTPRGVLTALDEAAGTTARAPLVPYAPIRREQVEAPAAVHRGDVVLLVAERGSLRITATGEAREDAGLGQQVRVLNRVSRKDVVGHVLDASTVAVEF
jgi:flagella basal body P-ring formation protein FlgA